MEWYLKGMLLSSSILLGMFLVFIIIMKLFDIFAGSTNNLDEDKFIAGLLSGAFLALVLFVTLLVFNN